MRFTLDPNRREGRESIKASASTRAGEITRLDCETREIIRNKEALRELARREFTKWWAERRNSSAYDERPDSLDVEAIQRLYIAYFAQGYEFWIGDRKKYGYAISEFDERTLEPLPPGPTTRVVDRQLVKGSRVYEVELTDPDYPGDRLVFEVQVDSHGETTLQER